MKTEDEITGLVKEFCRAAGIREDAGLTWLKKAITEKSPAFDEFVKGREPQNENA